MTDLQKKKLVELYGERVRWNCSLQEYTSFVIGGPAVALVEVDNRAELQQLLTFCHEGKINWRVIGGGTNLLVNDQGYDGIVIHLGSGFKRITSHSVREGGQAIVRVGCGFGLSKLADWCADKGFSGLEFASGIPGNLGGAIIMNAGAWGSEISDPLVSIEVVSRSEVQVIKRQQLRFGYRCWYDHLDKQKEHVVAEVTFTFKLAPRNEVKNRCMQIREKRRKLQPHGKGNCGSFFKNPPNDSAGRLIEACGLKGARIGGAMVSTKHANFFINTGDATASDMICLMEMVQKKVQKHNGILLEPEVHFL